MWSNTGWAYRGGGIGDWWGAGVCRGGGVVFGCVRRGGVWCLDVFVGVGVWCLDVFAGVGV